MAQYAEGTKVPAKKTRDEIETLLEKYGADAFLYGMDRGAVTIGFRIAGRHVRIALPLADEQDFRGKAKGAFQQDVNERWRALLLTVKAKLVAVDRGISTIEREFLVDIIMPNNRTVGELLQPQLEAAYQSGKMPPLLTGPTS